MIVLKEIVCYFCVCAGLEGTVFHLFNFIFLAVLRFSSLVLLSKSNCFVYLFRIYFLWSFPGFGWTVRKMSYIHQQKTLLPFLCYIFVYKIHRILPYFTCPQDIFVITPSKLFATFFPFATIYGQHLTFIFSWNFFKNVWRN